MNELIEKNKIFAKSLHKYLVKKKMLVKCANEIKTPKFPNGCTYSHLQNVLEWKKEDEELVLAVGQYVLDYQKYLESVKTDLGLFAERYMDKILSQASPELSPT